MSRVDELRRAGLVNVQDELEALADRYQLVAWCERLGGAPRFWALIESVPSGSRNVPTHLHLSEMSDTLIGALINLHDKLRSAVPDGR